MTACKPPERPAIGIGILLAVVVALVFCQTIRHEFVDYDDGQYFFTNSHVETGLNWNNALWAFRTTYASNWHPLTWLSSMVDVELFGTGPLGPHLTNALLHAANTMLLFLLLRRLTGAHWRSAFVAALFGLHPLHVESVAWASERKDVLSGLFFMLTLLMYARYAKSRAISPVSDVRRPDARAYWSAVFFFMLGLMSKPMLATLPFVPLLLDYWPLNRFALSTLKSQRATVLHLVLEKLPFLVFSLASSAVTLVAQREAVQPFDHIPPAIRAVT